MCSRSHTSVWRKRVASSAGAHSMASVVEFVWIASYPHGHRRLGFPGLAKDARCLLEPEAWFEHILNTNNLNIQSRKNNKVDVQTIALVRLVATRPQQWTVLAIWSNQARLLWKYLGCPKDAFVLQIERVWPCEEPRQVFLRRRHAKRGPETRERGFGEFAKVTLSNSVFWNRDSLHGHVLLESGGLPTSADILVGILTSMNVCPRCLCPTLLRR